MLEFLSIGSHSLKCCCAVKEKVQVMGSASLCSFSLGSAFILSPICQTQCPKLIAALSMPRKMRLSSALITWAKQKIGNESSLLRSTLDCIKAGAPTVPQLYCY